MAIANLAQTSSFPTENPPSHIRSHCFETSCHVKTKSKRKGRDNGIEKPFLSITITNYISFIHAADCYFRPTLEHVLPNSGPILGRSLKSEKMCKSIPQSLSIRVAEAVSIYQICAANSFVQQNLLEDIRYRRHEYIRH